MSSIGNDRAHAEILDADMRKYDPLRNQRVNQFGNVVVGINAAMFLDLETPGLKEMYFRRPYRAARIIVFSTADCVHAIKFFVYYV